MVSAASFRPPFGSAVASGPGGAENESLEEAAPTSSPESKGPLLSPSELSYGTATE